MKIDYCVMNVGVLGAMGRRPAGWSEDERHTLQRQTAQRKRKATGSRGEETTDRPHSRAGRKKLQIRAESKRKEGKESTVPGEGVVRVPAGKGPASHSPPSTFPWYSYSRTAVTGIVESRSNVDLE